MIENIFTTNLITRLQILHHKGDKVWAAKMCNVYFTKVNTLVALTLLIDIHWSKLHCYFYKQYISDSSSDWFTLKILFWKKNQIFDCLAAKI